MKLLHLAWVLLVVGTPNQTPEQIAHKRRHLDLVLEELASRDTSHLAPAQREARARALERLRAYSARGRFPINDEFPGWEVPYFIDRRGTRCALAQVIDDSGHDALVRRLARQDNHAYVAGLERDKQLAGWLRANGLTLTEAAFIQGPGFDNTPPPDQEQEVDRTPPPVVQGPQLPAPRQGAGEPDAGSGDIGTPAARRGIEARGRGRTARRAGSTWQQWWSLNRAAYVNLRARYHQRFRILPGWGTTGRQRRAGSVEVSRLAMPMIVGLAKSGDVRATALMAWARVGRAGEREQAVAACLAYLAQSKNRYRKYVLLALGVTRDAGAFDPLVDVMLDLPDGRKVLGKKTPIAEPMRAMAAAALGALGDPDAIEHLIAVLSKDDKDADLKSAAVTSLGLLAHHARREVSAFLGAIFKQSAWPTLARAAIPAALARAGALEPVVDHLRRFRGPTAVRQSCALAIGLASPRMTVRLVEILEASALRDTDALVRRFAAIALGEVAMRDRGDVDVEARDRAFRFYRGAFIGRNTQATDRAWHYLSAALFAKRFKDVAPELEKRLAKAARSDKSRDARAAATLALGLCGRADLLAKLSANDAKLAAYLAEARGLAGDRAALEGLLAQALKHPSEDVRYHAALGVGLLGEPSAMVRLVGALATESSRPAQAALTRVVGEVGDRASLVPLIELAKRTNDAWVRRRALAAIGLLGQQADRSWNYAFMRGQNFAALTPALRIVLSLF